VADKRIEGGIEWYTIPGAPEQPQCARCGSSVEWLSCWDCGGEGHHGSACWDDLCHGNEECIHGDEDMIPCDTCAGEGGSLHCLSDRDYCLAHPLPGRENIDSTAFSDARAWDD
jgi:hypothetical protein